MKSIVVLLLCLSAIAFGDDCGPVILRYYSCINAAQAPAQAAAGPSVPIATAKKQISECFTKASCKDPLAASVDKPDDSSLMYDAISSCLDKVNDEEEKPLVEKCIATTAKLTGYHFNEEIDAPSDESADKLLSVASAVYSNDFCTNDAARTAAATCLEGLAPSMLKPADAEECKKSKMTKELASEKQRFQLNQNIDYCYNNMSQACRQTLDSLYDTTCECAKQVFKPTPAALVKKFNDCVTSTVGTAVAGRLGAQLTDALTDSVSSIGRRYCPIVLNATIPA